MQTGIHKHSITIVLNRPKYAGNIGSVARCAKNMGMEKLIVVTDEPPDMEEMKQMSTHFAANLIDGIQYFERLDEALAAFQYIVGTTSRLGSARGPVITPREMAIHLADISHNNNAALLFGPEDAGLSNHDLRYCHQLVTIPTSDDLRSLNLSHAVMILCYEIFLACSDVPKRFTPRLASSAEIEGMHEHVKGLLTRIGFLNPENPDYWMMHIRRLLSRTKLSSKEVKIIQGICRQMEWYGERHTSGHSGQPPEGPHGDGG